MRKFNFDDPNVWDQWREAYDTMTDEEHKAFAAEAEMRYPTQQHFTYTNFAHLFSRLAKPNCDVLEVGGWKGELAKHCLEAFKIKYWLNIEFCEEALNKQVEISHPEHYTWRPSKFNWFEEDRTNNGDVLISAHTIEHFSDAHMAKFIKWLSGIPLVMFEAPINHGENDWRGYVGTHILKMGWDKINELMAAEGYACTKLNAACYYYELKK